MSAIRMLQLSIVLCVLCGYAWGADVVLNEYNAVAGSSYLGGGNSAADAKGGRASDSYFGRVEGNGGDWFELVVIKDHLDMRKWKLDLYDNKILDETLDLTNHSIWSDLRSGTIITVAEDVPSDVSYDPAGGDWWINVQARDDADGLYIEASSFKVTNNDWQLRIRNAAGTVVLGPAGEGISPLSGISGTNVFKLKDDPSVSIAADSKDYSDGSDFSTFGAPNHWGVQDFNDLRPKLTAPAEAYVKVLAPNTAQTVDAGDIMAIQWESKDIAGSVLVEFSSDGGASWSPVYPPNVGNTGTYKWLVPLVDSDQCLIRASSSERLSVYDVSDAPFTIVGSTLAADLTGDFTALVAAWLQ
jgi:hypothetical protein